MKNQLLIIVLACILVSSTCRKEEIKPIQSPFIGRWICNDPFTQYTIQNITGTGLTVNFLVSGEGATQYLYVNLGTQSISYKVLSISDSEMILLNQSNNRLTFRKI